MAIPTEEYIRRLKEAVDQLKSLLDDPHPGLHTWVLLVGEKTRRIVNLWNGDEGACEP